MTIPVVEGEMTLTDGRTLAYVEWGVTDGPVVVLCHPALRVPQPGWDSAATVGVRVVLADRPGLGYSTFQPGRSILDWPLDVAALMSHLDVDGFWVAGVSASTPYALACGMVLPARVNAVGLIAGTTPVDESERDTHRLATLAVADPGAALAEIREDMEREVPGQRAAERPEPDGSLYAQPEVQAALAAAGRETNRQGVDGPAQERLLRLQPWGFGLSDLPTPCVWWHGAVDSVVPLPRVERAIAGMSQHSLHVIPDAGHGVCMTEVDGFLRALVAVRGGRGSPM